MRDGDVAEFLVYEHLQPGGALFHGEIAHDFGLDAAPLEEFRGCRINEINDQRSRLEITALVAPGLLTMGFFQQGIGITTITKIIVKRSGGGIVADDD